MRAKQHIKVTIAEIAGAAGVSYKVVYGAVRKGRLDPENLRSVSLWIVGRMIGAKEKR